MNNQVVGNGSRRPAPSKPLRAYISICQASRLNAWITAHLHPDLASHDHERACLTCVMHSRRSESSRTLTKTHAARPRFERFKHEGHLCILLYKKARHPAAWVNIVLRLRVPRVCRMLWADDWYDTQSFCVSEHAETHTAQSVTCEVQIKPVGEYCQLWSSIWSVVICITFAAQCWFFFSAFLYRKWRT